MKRLACLIIVAASALPCAASGPKVDRLVKLNRPSVDPRQNVMMAPKIVVPPKLLNDEMVCAVLFPGLTATREAMRLTGLTKWLEAKRFHAERHLWMNDNGAR
jgi:hypothetical protein